MSGMLEHLKAALADRYAIERELGAGGMATVYLAEDVKHHRKVAVKVLRPELAAVLGPDRFLREIDIAARLTHPHILPLHDSGDADGFLYYVMPYVDGESLRDKLAREAELPIAEAVRILREVVDALAKAHSQGVVHRDIKPDNVMLSDRHALVTDFGVAKAVSEATGRQALTTAGMTLGTPAYMAPEQATADPHIDHRADIYAVGVMAYELLTGRTPFTATTPQGMLAAHVTDQADPVSKHRDRVSAELEAVVMKCLAKRPADRWQTAEELLSQLEAQATPGAGFTPTGAQWFETTRTRKHRVAVAVGAAVLLIAGSVLWWSPDRGARELDANLVTVLPFRTAAADPELQYLREGIVDLLFARLTGEGGPRALAPQTAIGAWVRAVGSPRSDLPEDDALELASGLGSAHLLQGGIVGTASHMTLNATMLDVTDGSVTARANVEGPADSLPALIDRLTAQLLALRAGVEARTLSDLTSTSLTALKAYLEGQAEFRRGRYVEALEHFDRALQDDSTFALAALWQSIDATWGTGRSAAEGRRLAWAHRDRLGPRDRTLLDAWVGSNYPDPTPLAQWISDAERAVDVMRDRWESWFLLGDRMYHFGTLVGLPEPLDRAMGAFERALELNPDFGPIMAHLIDHAVFIGDTAILRELRARYHATLGPMRLSREWLSATALGDSAALEVWRGDLDSLRLAELRGTGITAQQAGLGLVDAELAVKTALERSGSRQETSIAINILTPMMLNLGRPRAALEFARREAEFELNDTLHFHHWNHITRTLFWGADETLAVRSAQRLEPLVGGPVSPHVQIRRRQIGDHCNLGIWNGVNGNRQRATRALAWLRAFPDDEPPLGWHAFRRTCVATLEAVVAGPADRQPALARLDSLLRTGPSQHEYARRWMNLIAASLYGAAGDFERALAAVRRREFGLSSRFESTFYREEGRLAALAGDTAGAIEAYRRYLALRFDPEPELLSEANQVRADLARLVGEPEGVP